MKKLILVLTLVFVLTLSACSPEEEIVLDYSSFESHLISSYDDATFQHENKYIVYYYSQNCGHCATVKEDILNFFNTYEGLPFYIFEVSQADDVSSLEEFVGTPTIFIMSDSIVSKAYIGSDKILDFITDYTDLEIDYDTFENQHLTSYQEALDIEKEIYLLYYYTPTSSECVEIQNAFLSWVYTKTVEDIYFLDSENMIDPIPSELTILSNGVPIIVIISDGEYTGEYYKGSEAILGYIESIGTGKIASLQ